MLNAGDGTLPLVGRKAEITTLHAALAKAKSSRGSTAIGDRLSS